VSRPKHISNHDRDCLYNGGTVLAIMNFIVLILCVYILKGMYYIKLELHSMHGQLEEELLLLGTGI
jgi:hypothetical protein